jgi:outer membrane protein X
MKKYIFMAVVALLSVFNANAEQNDISAAVQFVYASKHSMAGLGAQVQFEPATNFRIAPEFIYFFENNHRSAINANLNLHYVIHTSSAFALYPLLGFSYGNYKVDSSLGNHSDNLCGANVGVGAEYRVQQNLYFFSEERFQIMKDRNQSVTVLGLKYTF